MTDRITGEQIVGLIVFETDTPVGSVPEPAAWVTIIGGFGLVGSAMRRRGTPVMNA